MAATAKEQSLGTKPTMLAVVFVLLALFRSSISLLDAVYAVHFLFGATMEFSDHESSPDPLRSDGTQEKTMHFPVWNCYETCYLEIPFNC